MAAGHKVAFFDCYSGASGDMVLGALLDLGLDVAFLRHELTKLGLKGWRLEANRVVRDGLAGTQVQVRVQGEKRRERRLADIEAIIESSGVAISARERALEVFRRLAAAEAQVHGISPQEVHFHEVGAIDAIVDIVGAAVALDALDIRRVHASSLPLATGSVEAAHGALPLPAPATLSLLAAAGAPTRPAATDRELVTPTGAAILTTVAEFSQPSMVLERVGVGFGSWELPWPNVLRVWLGAAGQDGLETGEVTVIETNLDDSSPEHLAFAMERLFEAGALDVFFTAAQMKKNRPGVVLTVLALPACVDELARVILRETTSLGVRFRTAQRLMVPRRSDTVPTRFGPIQVKIKLIDGKEVVSPEYEDCARIARERAVPIASVYEAVASAGVGGAP